MLSMKSKNICGNILTIFSPRAVSMALLASVFGECMLYTVGTCDRDEPKVKVAGSSVNTRFCTYGHRLYLYQ